MPYKEVQFQNGVLDQWIEALESGEYKQCRFTMKRDDRYCCLGVLCDILEPDAWGGFDPDRARSHEGNVSLPGSSIAQKVFGLKAAMTTRPVGVDVSIDELNDTGSSFEEIAQIIESTRWWHIGYRSYLSSYLDTSTGEVLLKTQDEPQAP